MKRLTTLTAVAVGALGFGLLAPTTAHAVFTKAGELFADQTLDVGEVLYEFDGGNNLIVKIKVDDPDWIILACHIDIADSLGDIPQNSSMNPKVGQFGYNESFDSTDGVTECQTPSTGTDGDVVVAAHAKLLNISDPQTVTTSSNDDETLLRAFAGCAAASVNDDATEVLSVNPWHVEGQFNSAAKYVWCEDPILTWVNIDDSPITPIYQYSQFVKFENIFDIPGYPLTSPDNEYLGTCDNDMRVALNMASLGEDGAWETTHLFNDTNGQDVSAKLKPGFNTLAVEGWNWGSPPWGSNMSTNPAMCIYELTAVYATDTATGWGEGDDFGGKSWATYFMLSNN